MYNDGDPIPRGKYGEQSSMSLINVHIPGEDKDYSKIFMPMRMSSEQYFLRHDTIDKPSTFVKGNPLHSNLKA